MLRVALLLLIAVLAAAPPCRAAEDGKCGSRLYVLWGDGKHDDTQALNAWFRGDAVVWGDSGRTVGAQIAGRVFLLSSAIYISSGSDRRIEHFEFFWPQRQERVSGGTIVASPDPNQPPVATDLTKIGSGPNEGVPYHSPPPPPTRNADRTGCLVS